MPSNDVLTRNSDGDLAVRTVNATEQSVVVNPDDVYTRDTDGNLCIRTTGNGGGGSVDYNRVVEKSATIPAATSSNVGKVYMYSGETNATYTHGYIYECQETTEYSSTVEFNPASLSGTTVTCSGDDFIALVEEWGSGNISDIIKGTLTYDESGGLLVFVGQDDTDTTVCTFQLYTQDYEDAGFTFTGTLQDGDVITFACTITETSSYGWVRINVQPASGGSAVDSVNGQTGAVVLTASDVGALPDSTVIPAAQVNADWAASSGVAEILNKPTIPDPIQYSSMPIASATNEGDIVQFTGTTDATYTNGYFYKCVSDGQNPATYSWEAVEVQAGSGGGLPSQTGNEGKFLKTDGTDASWENVATSPATTPVLVAANWVNDEQTINVTGVTATNTVIVSPTPVSAEDYANASILCTNQGSGTLTFACQSTPVNDLGVNVVII